MLNSYQSPSLERSYWSYIIQILCSNFYDFKYWSKKFGTKFSLSHTIKTLYSKRNIKFTIFLNGDWIAFYCEWIFLAPSSAGVDAPLEILICLSDPTSNVDLLLDEVSLNHWYSKSPECFRSQVSVTLPPAGMVVLSALRVALISSSVIW